MKTPYTIILFCLFLIQGFSQDPYEKIRVSDDVELYKISENAYVHVSYTYLPQYGRIPSNGLVYILGREAFLFDTPMTDALTKDLVSWIQDTMGVRIRGFVPNHWHVDCMGGLDFIHKAGIESWSNEITREIAKSKNLPVPKYGFKDSLLLKLNDREIICSYLGAAHAVDNIVVWIPAEKILFAGCMVKEMNAGNLGNVADADVKEWPVTLKKLLNKYADARIVIPGHGMWGSINLIEHTLELLE